MARLLALFLALLASSSPALSQAESGWPEQSAPFKLVLVSQSNSSINDRMLGACHAGALIQSLCLGPKNTDNPDTSDVFYFNTSKADNAYNPATGTGLLTWTFPVSEQNPPGVNIPMTLVTNPASNLAFPIIQYGHSVQPVTFTTDNLLAIRADTDDTATPPGPFATAGGVVDLDNRWAVCDTYYAPYGYTNLQFVLGYGEPQNPSCQPVQVRRDFI